MCDLYGHPYIDRNVYTAMCDLYGHPNIDSNHDDGVEHGEQLRQADLVVGLGEHAGQDEESNLREKKEKINEKEARRNKE